jgi:hypothetical protein
MWKPMAITALDVSFALVTTNLPLWASSDPFTHFSSHDLFIRSAWTFFASIVTCSWNGLEQY